ncbi:MAG TPA: metal-dependent hydrolase [Anaeromyxobacter sp.]
MLGADLRLSRRGSTRPRSRARRGRDSRRLLAAGVVASVLPDLDVVGLRLGIPYEAALGHRGASHSLGFAVAVAIAGAALHGPLRCRARTAFAFLLAATASHALLDALTSGGLGVALLWPFSDERFFAPFRPIRVAPLGLHGLRARGLALPVSEASWVWAPSAVVAAVLAWGRRRSRGAAAPVLPDPGDP